MEITSEPKFDTINVTDIDVAYPGDIQSYTLRDGVDEYRDFIDHCRISFGSGGDITFNKQLAHWIAVRPRTIRVPVPTSPAAE